MHLYLLRHGEAIAGPVDVERPLSDRGRGDVERLTAFLARSGVRVPRVCESGRLRAAQTAQIAAARLAPGVAVETMPGLGPEDPVEPWVDRVDGAASDLLIVGHMPFLGRLATRLLAPGAPSLLALSPASLVCLQHDRPAWFLAWMVRPELVV